MKKTLAMILLLMLCLATRAFAQRANPSYFSPTLEQGTMVTMGGAGLRTFFDDFFRNEINGNIDSFAQKILIYDFYCNGREMVYVRKAALSGFSEDVDMNSLRTFWALLRNHVYSRLREEHGRMYFSVVFDGSLIFVYDKLSGNLVFFKDGEMVYLNQKQTKSNDRVQLSYVDLGDDILHVYVVSYIKRNEVLRFYRLEKMPWVLGASIVRLPWRLIVTIPWSPIPQNNVLWLPVRTTVLNKMHGPYYRETEMDGYLNNPLRLQMKETFEEMIGLDKREFVGIHLESSVSTNVYLDVQFDSVREPQFDSQLYFRGDRIVQGEEQVPFDPEYIFEQYGDPEYLAPGHEFDIGQDLPGTDINFSFSHGDVPPRSR